ncbi:hypothetical protein LEP1GSC005_1479 [Leptospira santarosai str. ST188]|nr:hypothetical protein LEP1GSC005_1479 [Leptospira santarosai str. ST188]EMO33828.1 hypothetical protein LEP1GSC175_2490 [Leptospira santarosai str. HAI821]
MNLGEFKKISNLRIFTLFFIDFNCAMQYKRFVRCTKRLISRRKMKWKSKF